MTSFFVPNTILFLVWSIGLSRLRLGIIQTNSDTFIAASSISNARFETRFLGFLLRCSLLFLQRIDSFFFSCKDYYVSFLEDKARIRIHEYVFVWACDAHHDAFRFIANA